MPLDIRDVTVTDEFWHAEQELVRTAVIPYQWRALNDRVPGAAPSYTMHNFKAAARLNQTKAVQGKSFVPPTYTFRGFNTLPEDPKHPDPDTFYGFVFQDSDFSKWIEAVGYSLAHHPDDELESIADGAINIVCAAQLDNGYLDTYYILNGMDRAFTNLQDHHELYCFGHLTEGAVAYYQGTGKRKLLDAACRFADYILQRFGPGSGQIKGYPGHEIAEMALMRLADATGESRYRELAEYFIGERGRQPYIFDIQARERALLDGNDSYKPSTDPDRYAYYQAHLPVVAQREAVGHAVRAMYLYSGMADVARAADDVDLVSACQTLWRNVVDRKLYVTGGVGGTSAGEAFSFDYDLPNDTAYSETCAAIGLVFFARRMLQIQPVSEYGDVMEAALYNTVLAGMALDGKSFFYVNPLEVFPEACRKDVRKSHVKPVRQQWFGCACCPPNIARIIESVQEYAYTSNASTLFTHLYVGGSVRVTLDGHLLTMDMQSDMPWHGVGKAIIHVDSASTGSPSRSERCPAEIRATLAFRLPGWAGGEVASSAISASGERRGTVTREIHNGYIYFTGLWREGDAVAFDFPMPVHMVAANPRVREDIGKVAFTRGPITFCAEERDNGGDLHALHVDVERVGNNRRGIDVENFEFIAGSNGQKGTKSGKVDRTARPMVRLVVPAWRESVPSDEDGRMPLYHEHHPIRRTPVNAVMIPYYAWANRGENEMSVWLRE